MRRKRRTRVTSYEKNGMVVIEIFDRESGTQIARYWYYLAEL